MANTLKFGNGEWYGKKDTILAYNSENNNYKPLPFDFSRGSSATRVNKDGLIETVGSGEPRIDFKDDTKGSLLLEPQRSNLITYSEDFSQWSLAGGSSISSNQSISPDGTLNADNVSSGEVYVSGVGSSGNTYTFSCYYKGNAGETFIQNVYDGSNHNRFTRTFNGQWQRFSITVTLTNSGIFYLVDDRTGGNSLSFSAWGAQVEQGSYATSYIPTSGSAVTRVADVCNNGGNDQVVNSTEGVLYIEADILKTSGTGFLVSISDGLSLSESINIRQQSSGTLSFQVSSGGSNTFVNTTDWSEGVNKIALRYNSTGINVYINGNSKGTNSAITYPNINNLDIASRPDQIGQLIELLKVKDIRVYNTALTDQELIALTS